MVEKKEKYYKNSKKWREHEIQMQLLKTFQGPNGYDIMLLMGVAGGAGVALVGEFMKPSSSSSSSGGATSQEWAGSDISNMIGGVGNKFTWLGPMNPLAIPAFLSAVDQGALNDASTASSGKGGMSIVPMGQIMTIAGTGFAGSCLALLMLRAIFGTGGMAEVLKGIGEIVPL